MDRQRRAGRSVTRTRNNPFTIRLNEHERKLLERIAEMEGLSMSEAVRYLVRRYLEAGTRAPRKQ